eukprot:51341-Eustigmatos_ZCMA.PRE.1
MPQRCANAIEEAWIHTVETLLNRATPKVHGLSSSQAAKPVTARRTLFMSISRQCQCTWCECELNEVVRQHSHRAIDECDH